MMKERFIYILFGLVFFGCENQRLTFEYPQLVNDKEIETHFGISYTNVFPNLENIEDENTINWFKKQDSIAEKYFNNDNFKEFFTHHELLENRDTDPARGVKYNESNSTFFLSKESDNIKSDKDLIFKKTNKNSKAELIYDPSQYRDGEYEIEYYVPSYNGEKVAIALGKQENFFNDIIILNCETKQIIGKTIVNAKPLKAGGIVWSPNGNCILYIAYPNQGEENNDRNSYTALYCVDNEPKAIFKDGENGVSLNQEYYPVPKISSRKSNFLFIYNANASDFWDCYYIKTEDFKKGKFNWKKLYSEDDTIFHDWGTERNNKYYFKRLSEDNIELCMVELNNSNFENPKVLFKGNKQSQLSGFEVTKDNVYYTVTKDGIETSLYRYLENTDDEKITLPISSGSIEFKYRSPYHNDLWITISGWTANPKDYYLNPDTLEFEFVELGMWPDYPEFNNIISEVVEVESHDGVKIPMSIVRRKDYEMNGTSMGIISAYGAYGISETPWFHSPLADFVNSGNIYVSAHVRGGGEKGPRWYKAGMKSTKENSWKDLIACSQYLIDKKYVNPNKLGLNVNSAGGITGGMAVNERPDLYGAFSGFIPKLNPIRIEYLDDFDDSDNTFEFGTIKNKTSYNDLLNMDPVINLSAEKEYPSTLLIIGYNDYLVPPSDSGKYIASLQSFNSKSDKPYLLDVKFDSEHEINWLDDYARMLFFTISELEKQN